MKLSTEAKVGAVSIMALVMLAYMIVYLGNFSFSDKGYEIKAVFSQVDGLKQGNVVRYAGVDVGQVKAVEILPEGIKATLLINPGVKIAASASYRIGADGLLGEKHVNIIPPARITGFVQADETVRGQEAMGLDQVLESSDRVLGEVHQLVRSLNEIIGDAKVKDAIKATVLNTKELTGNLNEMSAALARMARNNEGDINSMVHNLSTMAGTLSNVAGRVDSMLSSVDNDGKTAQDLRETIQNIKNASARVEKMASSLEGVVTDPETSQNIRETLRNARSVSEKANKMLSKVDAISVQAGVEGLYSHSSGKYQTNADVRVNTSPQDFALIGVNNIGEGSKVNLQIGKNGDGLGKRVGIVDGKAGMGLDAALNEQFKVSLDVYDPNDVRVKLRTQYQLNPQMSLIGQTDSLNKGGERSTYIGVRRSF